MKAALAITIILLTGCATTPMNRDVLRAHAERNCRVEAATNKAYKVDSTGVDVRNTAYASCMQRHLH